MGSAESILWDMHKARSLYRSARRQIILLRLSTARLRRKLDIAKHRQQKRLIYLYAFEIQTVRSILVLFWNYAIEKAIAHQKLNVSLNLALTDK